MHTCHYRNELVGAVHGCTKCRLKSNHEIAGVSPYHSSSSLPPTHPLSSASPTSPSPLFSYSATPLRSFLLSVSLSLARSRSSFLFPRSLSRSLLRSLARSFARSLACLLACFPENLSTRVWLSYVFATHGGPVQISDEERIRVYVFWIPVDGWSFALKNRGTRSRLNTLPRSRGEVETLWRGITSYGVRL